MHVIIQRIQHVQESEALSCKDEVAVGTRQAQEEPVTAGRLPGLNNPEACWQFDPQLGFNTVHQ